MAKKCKLTIAIQKNGRLNNDSLNLLTRCGLQIKSSKNQLFYQGENLDINLILVRDDDIPLLVADHVCDVGIVGKNVLRERELELLSINGTTTAFSVQKSLAFGHCRLCLAVPRSFKYRNIQDLDGAKIATSYPYSLKYFLQQNNIRAKIIHLVGSVEIAPTLKIADLICDLVATGETLKNHNLLETHSLFESEAVLFKANQLSNEKQFILNRLLCRIDAVLAVKESKYIMFHLPKEKISSLKTILPHVENPSIMRLNDDDKNVAIHFVTPEYIFWETLENLKMMGASSILVLPIEKILR